MPSTTRTQSRTTLPLPARGRGPRSSFATLDELIVSLKLLRVKHDGEIIVVIRTRNTRGEFIFGEANARHIRLMRISEGLREASAQTDHDIEAICVG